MKKFTILCSAIMASLFMFSCTDHISFPEDAQPVVSVSQKLENLTLDRVSDIALDAPARFSDKQTKSKSKTIAEIIPFSQTKWAKSEDSLKEFLDGIFIVTYVEGGFSVISTVPYLPEVLSYTESGRISETSEIPGGLDVFLNQLPVFAKELYSYNKDYITRAAPDTIPDDDGYVRVNFRDIWQQGPTEYYGPLLNTSWHQDYPYNRLCFDPQGAPAKAGCVPIAIAQVAAYHQYPYSAQFENNYGSLNWSAISYMAGIESLNDTDQLAVATLIRRIGQLCGTSYSVSASLSSIYSVPQALAALNYSSSALLDYNTSLMITSLKDYGPVIMQGGGHCWVVDGYICQPTYYYRVADLYDEYLNYVGEEIQYSQNYYDYIYTHNNWGENASSYCVTGVFQYTDNTQTVYNYNSYLVMVINISH